MIGWGTGTCSGYCMAAAAMMLLVGSTFPRANFSAEGISAVSQDRGERQDPTGDSARGGQGDTAGRRELCLSARGSQAKNGIAPGATGPRRAGPDIRAPCAKARRSIRRARTTIAGIAAALSQRCHFASHASPVVQGQAVYRRFGVAKE